MSEVWEFFLSIPSWIFSAVAGGFGAAVGVGIVSLFSRKKPGEPQGKGRAVVIGICTVLAIQGSIHGTPELKKAVALDRAMVELKANRLFSLLIREHPEIEPRLQAELKPILENKADKDGSLAFVKAQAVTARIVAEYFNEYLATGSDHALYRILQHTADAMAKFKEKPELCVSYHLGNPNFAKGDVTSEFISIETDLKADLVESAIANMDELRPAATAETIIQTLAVAYTANKFPVDDILKLGDVATLPPEEGCRIATEYVVAMVWLGEKEAGHTFKSMMALSDE